MYSVEEFEKVPACHTGQVDGYGYAFVAGNQNGVTLLDLRTKLLLEDMSHFEKGRDEKRIELLQAKRLIQPKNKPIQYKPIQQENIKSLGVWLHVTNNCNLGCGYCYIYKDQAAMTMKTARLFLDKLEATIVWHGIKYVQIKFAGGEPTLNKKIVFFIAEQAQKRFIEKGIDVKLRLITNGTCLTDEWVQFLEKFSVGICVSLDGVGAWNDATRPYKNGQGSFNKIDVNLKNLINYGIRPGILTTITEANIDGIPLLTRYLIDSNLRFRYAMYRDNTGGYGGHEAFIDELMYPLNDCYEYYAHAIREGRASFSHQLADIHLDRKAHFKSCNVGFTGVVVSHLGELFFCQAAMNRDSIGNLSDSRSLLEMVWSQQTVPDFYNELVTDYTECAQCKWALACGGGCPLNNLSAKGNTNTASPYCRLFKEMIPQLIELKALQIIATNSQPERR
ncbi:TPA: hypothetical protein DIC39_00235 [Patescibacteria group bacterium]|nr:MAG: Radical SAM domain-containing protein [Parcubacteria group bacterium GW2011_GWA2_46_39]HBV33304.1 hypothetical protein [Patescibacteria group bacterium]HCU47483.1 hypothetical protein [Patescibacteria group bacterium]